jgi:hypothetical protein
MTHTAPQTCDTCEHPKPGRHTSRCPDHIRDLLEGITERAPLISVLPREGASDVYRVPVNESRPPMNLQVGAMLDPRSKAWRLGPDDDPRPASRLVGSSPATNRCTCRPSKIEDGTSR